MAVFWDVAPCSRPGGVDVEAASASEMSVSLYHATRRNIQDGNRIHIRRRENLNFTNNQ
jgi:hypothetical protein